MRTLALLLMTGIAVTGCDAGDGPGTANLDPPLGAGPIGHELTLPVQHASSTEVIVYANLAGDHASESTELSYGLADGYPTRVALVPGDGFVLGDDCPLQPGPVIWRSIAEVQGDAAVLRLEHGAVTVELREEGDVSALLVGEVTQQHCDFAGSTVTTVPLQHRIDLHVRRVEGFEVEQFHQLLADCLDAMILPADALLWAPVARPFDATGARFDPANAPTPATITLRSDGALTLANEAGQLTAGPGTVTVTVDTDLPVRGLDSFTVVGPESLTAVDAALYLSKAVAKGSVVEAIEDGGEYQLFFPDQRNTVDLRVDAAMTAGGKLCANLPGAWFAATSATPKQCAASPANPEESLSGEITIADIHAPGECRLAVTIPGTDLEWTTRFHIAP
jgi:hypothetical protein